MAPRFIERLLAFFGGEGARHHGHEHPHDHHHGHSPDHEHPPDHEPPSPAEPGADAARRDGGDSSLY